MIVGQDGPVLVLSARDAFILRDAVVRWLNEQKRLGAQQKTTAVLPVLQEWERVADAYRATLIRSDSGPDPSAEHPPPRTLPETEQISTAKAALMLDCTQRHVRRLVAQGDLAAQTVGRAKLLDPADVQALRALRESA